jgi:proteasome alpha subunit
VPDQIKLEVAVLDRDRPRRAFRRLTGAALDALLPAPPEKKDDDADEKDKDGKDKGSDAKGDSAKE